MVSISLMLMPIVLEESAVCPSALLALLLLASICLLEQLVTQQETSTLLA